MTNELVKLAAGYIELKESRRAFRGKCPFHNDPGESLMISPEKNMFKCFGCGKEGGLSEFRLAIAHITQL